VGGSLSVYLVSVMGGKQWSDRGLMS